MKKLATNVLPIIISSDYQSFVNAYRDAKLNNSQVSKTYLLKHINPTFKKWERVFYSKDYSQDITISTLIQLLTTDNKPSKPIAWKISSLKNWILTSGISFEELCIEAFLRHLKKDTIVYDNYPTQLSFFFFIAKDVKMFLFKIIRRILQKLKKCDLPNSFYTPVSDYYLDTYIDWIYLDNIQNENHLLYSAYLLWLFNNSFTVSQIKDYYKINQEDSKQLKEDLCQLIETLQFSS
jgi:hypothetical protein